MNQKFSFLAVFIIVLLFIGGIFVISLTSRGAQQNQQQQSNAAGGPITISYTQGVIQNNTIPVSVQATTTTGIGFAEVNLSFDTTRIQLAQEITISNVLTYIDSKTTMAEANTTGKIKILLGLSPDNLASPPMGTFLLATLPMKFVTQPPSPGTIGIDTALTYFSDLDSNVVAFVGSNYTLVPPPTSTPLPTNTATPTNSPTPTRTPTPTSTNTPTPTRTPTPTPTNTPTPTRTPTPVPTNTPTPTRTPTPIPTNTPFPTNTATPTRTPTPTNPPPTNTSTPTSVPTVTDTPTRKIGDANGDGQVNGADYISWLLNYGTNTTQGSIQGDFSGDGMVNGKDYILWLNNYGK